MTCMLQAGMRCKASTPPAAVINLEAQVLPTKALRFGAIHFILLSMYD